MRVIDTLVNSIEAERPDFMLFLGDMVLDGRRRQDWDEYLFTPFKNIISQFHFALAANLCCKTPYIQVFCGIYSANTSWNCDKNLNNFYLF